MCHNPKSAPLCFWSTSRASFFLGCDTTWRTYALTQQTANISATNESATTTPIPSSSRRQQLVDREADKLKGIPITVVGNKLSICRILKIHKALKICQKCRLTHLNCPQPLKSSKKELLPDQDEVASVNCLFRPSTRSNTQRKCRCVFTVEVDGCSQRSKSDHCCW